MSDVEQWLNALGLEQYADAFRDNDIDGANLAHLTADDLREIGVTSVGHRRTLLAAIAKLTEAEPEKRSTDSAKNAGAAERRQLTVMFSDLVGSTALSEKLDPEDLRDVIASFQDACTTAITQYEGYVARFMGDGLLVYFGYPKAHEDEPERAVRAGLEIVDAVGELDPVDGASLGVRIGIATGEVVVGDIIGEGASEEHAVLGDTPNLAARLQALAAPGTVVIGDVTRRRIEGRFILEDLGPQSLKGLSSTVRAWRIDGESSDISLFQVAAHRGLTPMAGREEEVGMLQKRWRQASEGEGQVMVLTGEAGIGKSRVLQAFRDSVAGKVHNRIFQFCSPYHRNSALYPAIRQFQRISRFENKDDAEQKLDKLERTLSVLDLPPAEIYPVIAALLGLPAQERYKGMEMNPARLRESIMDVINRVIEAMAAQNPVLMIVEDVHWIDPTTLEMLSNLIERLGTCRILLIITARPEFETPWRGHTHLTALSLNRLSRHECTHMVARLVGGKALPEEVIDYIATKTDGVPLFVEELTKSILEMDLLNLDEAAGRYTLKAPLPELGIPASLQDSLMARLDPIPSAKELAQLASVIGRTFSHAVLSAVAEFDEDELAERLDLLLKAGLVFRRSGSVNRVYEFKHALVQDTAYESLLKSKRREIHSTIAHTLEESFPEIVKAEPQILAHHFAKARAPERAFKYWRRAGERAVERSANLEAVAHLEKALSLVPEIPDTPDRQREETMAQIALGVAKIGIAGFGYEGVGQAYLRARELAQQTGEIPHLFAATWGLWIFDQVRTRYEAAQDISDELLELARQQEDEGLVLQAHHAAWTTRFCLGDIQSTLEHTDAGNQIYDPQEHRLHAYHYGGHDPGVCSLSFRALTFWLSGKSERAEETIDQALILAHELGQPFSLLEAISFAAVICMLKRDVTKALEHALATASLSDAHGFGKSMFTTAAATVQGWSIAQQGHANAGIAVIEEAIATSKLSGSTLFLPFYCSVLAEVQGAAGMTEKSLATLAEALEIAKDTGERWWESEVLRHLAELSCGDAATTDVYLDRSIAVARETGALSLELRAATSQARVWLAQGDRSRARELLSSVYDKFSEGFDTPDLVDAKALIDG